MKKYFLLTLTVFIFTVSVFGQTSVVAYKSHSGNMRFFEPSVTDNLGLPPMSLDTIYLLSDTSVVEVSSMGNGWNRIVDTVSHHPYCNNPAIGFDSMKTYYPGTIIFVGFDSSKKSQQLIDTTLEQKEKSDSKKVKNKKKTIPVGQNLDGSSGNFIYFIGFLIIISMATGILIVVSNKKNIRIS